MEFEECYLPHIFTFYNPSFYSVVHFLKRNYSTVPVLYYKNVVFNVCLNVHTLNLLFSNCQENLTILSIFREVDVIYAGIYVQKKTKLLKS
jgi:hypothetical protein